MWSAEKDPLRRSAAQTVTILNALATIKIIDLMECYDTKGIDII